MKYLFSIGHKINLGKKRSVETKNKMSEAHKGDKNYWFKKKLSLEHKIKLSEARKNFYKNGGIHPRGMLGKRPSDETRRKMSEASKGEKAYNYKGGRRSKNKIIRDNIEYRLWREAVFARDNWTCQKCKLKGIYLHSHHIKNFSQYIELRFAIDNGITLCIECHNKFHKKYRTKDNNKEQINEFLTNNMAQMPQLTQ